MIAIIQYLFRGKLSVAEIDILYPKVLSIVHTNVHYVLLTNPGNRR